jgi:hypothetical protein
MLSRLVAKLSMVAILACLARVETPQVTNRPVDKLT